ncbi:MAG: TolC family protein [Phycisphaerales bacterium]|nr:TolC family protein [Phycisphaerales bacterium]
MNSNRTVRHARTPSRRCASLLLRACIAAQLLPLAACHGPFSDERFGEVRTPKERLRRVEAMDVQAMAAQEQDQTPPLPTEADEAAEILDLTLEECRAAALEGNLSLQAALFSPTIAATTITEEEARFEAVFSARAALSSSEYQTSSSLTSSEADVFDAGLAVQIPLRTGGTVSVDFPFSRTDRNLAFNTLNPSYANDLSVSISHNLLRGAGLRANTYGIRIAEYQRQEGEAQTKLEVIRILAEVDRLYWLLYAVRRELEVRQVQYELAVAQLERAERLVAAEQAPVVEILRAESGVADRLEDIIITHNRMRARQRQLKRMINQPDLPMAGRAMLIPVTEPNPVALNLDLDTLIDVALGERMEMLQLELQIAQDASTIDFEKNRRLPLLAVEYSYGLNAVDDSFGDTFNTIRETHYGSWRIGVRGEVPIGNQAAESRVHRAILRRLQRLATKSDREAAITEEVLTAADNLGASWQRLLASRQRVLVAARTLAAEQRQFDLGLRTSTDVLDAQARLADAQSSEITAITAYQVSQTDLAYATGMILGQAQIRWEPADAQ